MSLRKTTIVPLDYQGQSVHFDSDGWINATEIASRHGKRLDLWLRNNETQEYIAALARRLNTANQRDLIRTTRGRNGGTWLHPKLAVKFARWLSVDFEIWCDEQIDKLIHGEQNDWQHLRDSAAIGYQGMCDALSLTRTAQGKASKPHHYMNEARLINGVLFGHFKGVDRDSMTPVELRVIAMAEQRNTFLIGQGLDYHQRKRALTAYVSDLLQPRIARGSA